jgi:hypothetical protein
MQIEALGETLQVGEHRRVTGEARPAVVTTAAGVERIVDEGHEVPGQVGAQRRIQRAVDASATAAERVVVGPGRVHPDAADLRALLVDRDGVAASVKLPGRDQPGRAGADHGDLFARHGGGQRSCTRTGSSV